jgi:hypothetical protein
MARRIARSDCLRQRRPGEVTRVGQEGFGVGEDNHGQTPDSRNMTKP